MAEEDDFKTFTYAIAIEGSSAPTAPDFIPRARLGMRLKWRYDSETFALVEKPEVRNGFVRFEVKLDSIEPAEDIELGWIDDHTFIPFCSLTGGMPVVQ